MGMLDRFGSISCKIRGQGTLQQACSGGKILLSAMQIIADLSQHIQQLGCGSSLPALFLLQQSKDNHVDVQDYNEQVIKYITIPNILLNTLLTVQDATQPPELSEENDQESSSDEERGAEHGDYHEEEEDEEKDRIIGESATCDAEAELPEEQVPEMLRQLALRTRAFVGDWSGLPVWNIVCIGSTMKTITYCMNRRLLVIKNMI